MDQSNIDTVWCAHSPQRPKPGPSGRLVKLLVVAALALSAVYLNWRHKPEPVAVQAMQVQPAEKLIHVRGYTRKDGTVVKPHTRKAR